MPPKSTARPGPAAQPPTARRCGPPRPRRAPSGQKQWVPRILRQGWAREPRGSRLLCRRRLLRSPAPGLTSLAQGQTPPEQGWRTPGAPLRRDALLSWTGVCAEWRTCPHRPPRPRSCYRTSSRHARCASGAPTGRGWTWTCSGASLAELPLATRGLGRPRCLVRAACWQHGHLGLLFLCFQAGPPPATPASDGGSPCLQRHRPTSPP